MTSPRAAWCSVAVLVPTDGLPAPPEALPLGRAALALRAEGIEVVFGERTARGTVDGRTAVDGGWTTVRERPVVAAWDRFPGQSRPEAYGALLDGLAGVPVANPPSIDALCRDKLACQAALPGFGFPEVEARPEAFADALGQFGAAFLKPRFGSFGHGVRRVTGDDPLPATIVGLTGRPEPALLQRAVPPPEGFAGVAIRVHVQRSVEGPFRAGEPVARWSRTDPVVNAARGAGVVALRDAFPSAVGPAIEVSVAIADHLSVHPDGALLVELGVDLVIDPRGRVCPIEVNGKPRGRLERLAAGSVHWRGAHEALACGPLRWLAARFGGPA